MNRNAASDPIASIQGRTVVRPVTAIVAAIAIRIGWVGIAVGVGRAGIAVGIGWVGVAIRIRWIVRVGRTS